MILENNKRGKEKRQQQRLTKKHQKQIKMKKQHYKIWPTQNDKADFCHQDKYKDMKIQLRKDNNIDLYKAYNKDKRGREPITQQINQ